jgi:penicillin-binding protein 2
MLASPLQLAVMTARLATGRAVEPTIVKYSNTAVSGFPEIGLDEAKLDKVRAGLKAVVNEPGGTGKNAQLGDGRPLVAGKTGTSQTRSSRGVDRSHDELPWNARDHALFVAYVPADAPRYAVAAVVEHGGGGGAVAAPLVRDVIEAVLDLEPARAGKDDGAGTQPEGRSDAKDAG